MIHSIHLQTVSTMVAVIMATVLIATPVSAFELESFVQPYRTVHVPAGEMGVLSTIHVREGDAVQPGQLLAKLDDTVLQASKAVADASREAVSPQRAAEAERSLTEKQLRSYRELHLAGNATQREVDRAEGNYWQATTRLLAVKEDMRIRDLECKRLEAQIQRREIHSPIRGVVAAINKEVGEFVSPTDPVVMQVVELDQLKAVFSVPLSMVDRWSVDERVSLQIGANGKNAIAVIERISPVADADSASVRVTVRVDNAQRDVRSGTVCRWDTDAKPVTLKNAQSSQPGGSVVR